MPRSARLRAATVLATALLVLACTARRPETPETPRPGVEVTLAITSGLPPPYFRIEDPEGLRELRERLEGLPELTPREVDEFGAWTLHADEAIAWFPGRIVARDGVIRVATPNGSLLFYEDSRGLADYLQRQLDERGVMDRFPDFRRRP